MASRFNGPILNRARGGLGPRAWYSEMPIQIDPDYIVYYQDFLADLDTTSEFTLTKDGGASAALAADEDGGAVLLSSAATTDNDGNLLQGAQRSYSLSADKPLWFEARVKVADADELDAFIGLSTDASITNPEDILSEADRIGFQVDDGDASLLCKSEKDGTETSTDSGQDASDATYVQLGIYWDGKNKAEYYVDRALVATHTTNLPDDEQLAVALFELSGSAVGTQTMTADYILVAQKR